MAALVGLSLLLAACGGNGDSGERGGSGRLGPAAVDPEALVADAVERTLAAERIAFTYMSSDLVDGESLTFRVTAYPGRRAWTARIRQVETKPYHFSEVAEMRSIGQDRWLSSGAENGGCWLRLGPELELPSLPILDAGVPGLLDTISGLRGVSKDANDPTGINAELSLADAASLVVLPLKGELTAAGPSGESGRVPVFVRLADGRLSSAVMKGTDIVASARAAGKAWEKPLAKQIAQRHFRLSFNPQATKQVVRRPPAADVRLPTDDFENCFYDQ